MAITSKKVRPVIISPLAQQDIENIISYLSQNWNQKVVDEFLMKLRLFYAIISIHPHLFSYYNKRKNIRKYALTKQNIVYYRSKKSVVEIITVFDGRQDPRKFKNLLK